MVNTVNTTRNLISSIITDYKKAQDSQLNHIYDNLSLSWCQVCSDIFKQATYRDIAWGLAKQYERMVYCIPMIVNDVHLMIQVNS